MVSFMDNPILIFLFKIFELMIFLLLFQENCGQKSMHHPTPVAFSRGSPKEDEIAKTSILNGFEDQLQGEKINNWRSTPNTNI